MSFSFILSAVLLCIVSYLMGSVSTAILVCRALGYPDPRSEGSNNPGATNVLRIAGKGPALLTLAGDVGKGVLAILLGRVLSVDELTLALMGLAAFIGHLFPLYFNFEGGKGVATALGVITTLAWPIGLGIMLIWLVVAVLSRYSSLAALVSWALAPLLVYLY
ncbi:MAG TPA: glycerol-3-phosphate 1-O-acyltransferase PlsY, partial [Pseudomonadales bacterium]|nr:glycerol-3-phosphate 1-O-acyltransferase PlsY [Pseudomonadales bacterium]